MTQGVPLTQILLRIYLARLSTPPLLFDRHLLVLAPNRVLLFVLLTSRETRWRSVPFAAVVFPLAYYSLVGSHDVHAESASIWPHGIGF